MFSRKGAKKRKQRRKEEFGYAAVCLLFSLRLCVKIFAPLREKIFLA